MKVTPQGTPLLGDGIANQSAPDFGLALKSQGCSLTARLDFPFFQFDELGVIGPGQYTAMMMMMALGSVPHALSLDFGPEMLQRMLALAPAVVSTVITTELARDGSTPRRIALPAPIPCGISATLGEPQTTAAGRESFLPLIVQSVYPAWDEAPGKPESPLGGQPVKEVNNLRPKGRQAGLAAPRLKLGSGKGLSP
jgi:hypothetical protein